MMASERNLLEYIQERNSFLKTRISEHVADYKGEFAQIHIGRMYCSCISSRLEQN